MSPSQFRSAWREARQRQGRADQQAIDDEAAAIYDGLALGGFLAAFTTLNASVAHEAVAPAFTSPTSSVVADALASFVDEAPDAATLRDLFGSGDHCECSHCQSVLSPAAYLAELYRVLPAVARTRIHETRPDLETLALNCQNTTTELPYIDLVLELLEWMLAGNGTPSPRQTTHSADELELRPEHETTSAYISLSRLACPLAVPFDKWFEEARAYLDHLDVPLHRLAELMVPVKGPFEDYTWPSHRRRQLVDPRVVRAHLGLAVPAHALITHPIEPGSEPRSYEHTDHPLTDLWGIDTIDDVTGLDRFLGLLDPVEDDKMQGPGPSSRQAVLAAREILGQRYIQDSRKPPNRTIDIRIAPNCDAAETTISGLTEDTLLRLAKFERLRRAIGWTPTELNWAVMCFASKLGATELLGIDDLDGDVVTSISHVSRLATRRPASDIRDLLSWWGKIESGRGVRGVGVDYADEKAEDRRSLYEATFLDPSLQDVGRLDGSTDSLLQYFELGDSGELAYLQDGKDPIAIEQVAVVLAAAFHLPDRELTEVVEFVRHHFFHVEPTLKLRMAELSSIYRVVSLSRYLDLTPADFALAYRLISPHHPPFGSDTAETVLFVEAVDFIRASPLGLRDAAYLLLHHTASETELSPLEQRITLTLKRIRELLRQESTAPEATDRTIKSTAAEVRGLLRRIGYRPHEARTILDGLEQGESTITEAQLKQLMPFLTGAVVTEIYRNVTYRPGSPELYGMVLRVLQQADHLAEIVTAELSTFAALPHDPTQALITIGLGQDSTPGSVLESFLRQATAGDVPGDVLSGHLLRLDKMALIAKRLELHQDEIGRIAAAPTHAFQGWSFTTLPIEVAGKGGPTSLALASLLRYVQLRGELDVEHEQSLSLLVDQTDTTTNASAAAHEDALQRLADYLHVGVDDLIGAAHSLAYTDDDQTQLVLAPQAISGPEMLEPLIQAAQAARRLGRPFNQIRRWVTAAPEEPFALDGALHEDPQILDAYVDYKRGVVEEIRAATRARTAESAWRDVASGLQDRMRVKQRDRLLATLTGRAWSDQRVRLDAHDIASVLLVDPLVAPCVRTSRLKQAISSVQLLVQRALGGLEQKPMQELVEACLGSTWPWRKSYRVWEAHKRVVLTPENWIEPELRDDKTPFFTEFESELAQSDLDLPSIEEAFRAYLRKVDECGHLEVAAFTDEPNGATSTMHVVGRTRESPHTYYYRRRVGTRWTPWERVELDIDAETLLLVVHSGRLYAFWPTIKRRVQKLGKDDPNNARNERDNYRPVLEVSFNWSTYVHGRWTQRRRSKSKVEVFYGWDYHDQYDNPAELLDYDIRSTGERVEITLSLYGRKLEDSDHCTWNDTKLESKFLSVHDLVGRIDWEFIHGSDFTMDSQEINSLLKPPLDLARLNATLALYRGDNEAFVDPINALVEVVVPADADSGSGGIYGNILGTILYHLPQSFDNHNKEEDEPNKGLHKTDRKRVADFLNSWEAQASDFDVQTQKYREASLVERGIGGNMRRPVGRFTFAGYQMRDYSYACTGPVGSGGEVTSSGPKCESCQISSHPWLESPSHTFFDQTCKELIDQYDEFCAATETEFEVVPSYGSYRLAASNTSPMISLLLGMYGGMRHLFRVSEVPVRVTTSGPVEGELDHFFLEDGRTCHEVDLAESTVTPFFHPTIRSLASTLHDNTGADAWGRLDRLLALARQQESELFPYDDVAQGLDARAATIEFGCGTPFSIYNWEIWFHIPFTIAVRLSQDHKFEEAQRWFHYIFNPLVAEDDGDSPSKYWRFLPLHLLDQPGSTDPGDLLCASTLAAADPFQPHRIARARPGAYQRAVVIKYLDNLISWADDLFQRDTIESINEATHLYALAAEILGRRPLELPAAKKTTPSTSIGGSTSIDDYVDGMTIAAAKTNTTGSIDLSPATTMVEQMLPHSRWDSGPPDGDESGQADYTLLASGYPFCIPSNDRLLQYWDTVAQRLFKIRHCQDISGRTRELPVFEPPIDPALLVRGTALGLDIGALLSDLYAPLPPYRFEHAIRRALDLVADVQRLGTAILAALEKRDAEELAQLRNRHERDVLDLNAQQRRQRLDELKHAVRAAGLARDAAQARHEYYSSRPFENRDEKAQVTKLNIAMGFNASSQGVALAASAAYALPNLHQDAMTGSFNVETGGRFLGDAMTAMSRFLALIGAIYSHEATLHGIKAGHHRRMDDWQFQAADAANAVKQAEQQLLATQVRLAMAEHELVIHERQREQADEVADFLQAKFTGHDLYNWMASELSTLYFQTYRLALDQARTAQRCYRQELNEASASFVGSTYWNSLRNGLTAGDKLQLALRRMENAYSTSNRRSIELTKDIFLSLLNPMQLDLLRYTGSCRFEIPELLFDLDYPTHWDRRIKSLSVSIPAVVGPHTAVGCTLTMESSKTKRSDGRFDAEPPSTVPRSISLSTGRNDSGVFDVTRSDGRYLPFETCGVNSAWHIEFPSPYPSFERTTIPDIILHVRYTAQDGGTSPDLQKLFNQASATAPGVLGQRLDIRHQFSSQWHRLQQTGNLSIAITRDLFPYLAQPVVEKVTRVALLCEIDGDEELWLGQHHLTQPTDLGAGRFLFQHGPVPVDLPIGAALDLTASSPRHEAIRELVVVLFFQVHAQ